MTNAAAHQELYQSLDFVRVWKHIARLLGARNPDDFMKKDMTSRALPQEQIDKGVQEGRFAPVSQL